MTGFIFMFLLAQNMFITNYLQAHYLPIFYVFRPDPVPVGRDGILDYKSDHSNFHRKRALNFLQNCTFFAYIKYFSIRCKSLSNCFVVTHYFTFLKYYTIVCL